MTLLWLILAAMTLVGVMLVIWPVLNAGSPRTVSSEAMNAMVFRDRLQELDADLQQGRVTAEEHAQLRSELELTLLEDVAQGAAANATVQPGGKAVVWLALVLIPVVALSLYWKEGFTPEVKGWLAQQDRLQDVTRLLLTADYEGLEQQQVALPDIVRALQLRVQQDHEDHRSWYVLGMSYLQVQMASQAELAFSRALDLDRDNPDYLLGFTQASLLLNDGKLTEPLRLALWQLIQKQPANPRPYVLLGMAAFQAQDYEAAIEVWQQYLQRSEKDERTAELLQQSVAQAQLRLEQSQTEQVIAGEKPVVTVTVNVSDSVRLKLAASDTLFVYARAVNGPPMPLAVVRQPVGRWPVETQLSDDNAVAPGVRLSGADEVIVQARISASGSATPESGDWIGPTQVLKLQPGEQAVVLEINAAMP